MMFTERKAGAQDLFLELGSWAPHKTCNQILIFLISLVFDTCFCFCAHEVWSAWICNECCQRVLKYNQQLSTTPLLRAKKHIVESERHSLSRMQKLRHSTFELYEHVMSFWVTSHRSLIWKGPQSGTGLKCPPLFSSFIKADTVAVVLMLHRWHGARCHHLSSKHPEWQSLRWQNMNEEMRTEGSFKHIRRVCACSPKFNKDIWISSRFRAEFITTWVRLCNQHGVTTTPPSGLLQAIEGYNGEAQG